MTQLAIPRSDIAKIETVSDDASSYAANGYLVLKSAFPADQIDRLAKWTKTRFYSSAGELLCSRLQDEWKVVDLVRQLAVDPFVLKTLKRLYGREPIPFQTLNFAVGTEQRTHSDTIHFHCFPQRFMCGVWVALEKVDDHNGPLHYYPGSHRLPTLECADVGLSGLTVIHNPTEIYGQRHYKLYEDAIAELIQIAGCRKQTVRFEKGDALIWAANLLHGGEPILTPGSTRFSQVTHYYFEGCRLYTPLESDLTKGYVQFRDRLRDIRTDTPIPEWTATELEIPNGNGLFTRLGRKLDRIVHRVRFGPDSEPQPDP